MTVSTPTKKDPEIQTTVDGGFGKRSIGQRLISANTFWIALVLLALIVVFTAIAPNEFATLFTFQTLLIETEQVKRVIEDPRVAAVTLTGSTGAGGGGWRRCVLAQGGPRTVPPVHGPRGNRPAAHHGGRSQREPGRDRKTS